MVGGQAVDLCIQIDPEYTTIKQGNRSIDYGKHGLRGDLLEQLRLADAGRYQMPKEYGRRLYEAAVPERLREELYARLKSGVEGVLRLKLEITEDFSGLNWECLWRGTDGGFKPLACRPHTGMSRKFLIGADEIEPTEKERLNLLVAVADPGAHHPQADVGRIDHERITQTLQRVLPPEVHLEPLQQPVTVDRLRTRLARGDVDILHVVTHGISGRKTGLLLDDDVRPLKAEALADVIGTHPLSLVTLVACSSGKSYATPEGMSSFAETLLRHTDVGAVIAMYRPIDQKDALHFTEGLYKELPRGHDHAVLFDVAANQGRKTILNLLGEESWNWATPVLFSRDEPPRCLVRPSGVPLSPRRDSGGFQDEYHHRQGADLSAVMRLGRFDALWGSADPYRRTGWSPPTGSPVSDGVVTPPAVESRRIGHVPDQGRFAGAAEGVTSLAQRRSDGREPLRVLIDNLERRGDLAAALEACDRLISLDPGALDGRVRRVQIQASIARAAAENPSDANDRWQEALADATDAVHHGSWSAAAHLERARALVALYRLDEAQQAFELATELDASSVPGWVEYGWLLLERHDPTAALQAFERALSLSEACVAAHVGMGDALLELDGDDRARRSFGRALDRDPDHVGARRGRMVAAINLAQRARRLHRTADTQDLCDLAITDGEHAVRLDPGQPWVHAHFARALRVDYAYDYAVWRFEHARELAVGDVPVTATLLAEEGDTLRRWGSFTRQEPILERALARLDEALASIRHPRERAWVLEAKGLTLLTMGWLDRAEDAFRDSIASDDTYGWGFVGLGRTLLQSSRQEEAGAEFGRLGAFAAGRRRFEAWSQLGAIMSKTARGEALRLLAEGLPEFPDATHYLDRAEILDQLGQASLAERDRVFALGLEPERVDTRLAVGWSYLLRPVPSSDRRRRYRYQDAAAHARRAAELPGVRRCRPHCLHLLGWAHFLLGELQQAVGVLRQARSEQPRDLRIRLRLEVAEAALRGLSQQANQRLMSGETRP